MLAVQRGQKAWRASFWPKRQTEGSLSLIKKQRSVLTGMNGVKRVSWSIKEKWLIMNRRLGKQSVLKEVRTDTCMIHYTGMRLMFSRHKR